MNNLNFYFNISYLYFLSKFYEIEDLGSIIKKILILGGPVFIKIGQNLSQKEYLSDNLKQHLIELRDENFSNIDINKLKIDNLKLNLKPIAAGCVAQVYTGYYKNDKIILKILHDNIKDKINNSISLFEELKNLLGNSHSFIRLFNDIVNLEDLYHDILEQSDLNNEVRNLLKFRNNFKDFPNISFPNVIKHDENFIIETFEEGYFLDEFNEYCKNNNKMYYMEELLALINCLYYKMIFDNHIHTDLHFSNFKIRIENEQVVLIVLDHGLIHHIPNKKDLKAFLALFKKNMFVLDLTLWADVILHFAFDNHKINEEQFKNDVEIIFEKHKVRYYQEKLMNNQETNYDEMSSYKVIIEDLTTVLINNNIKLPAFFLSIQNGFVLLDDINCNYLRKGGTSRLIYNYAKKNGYLDDIKQSYKNNFIN